MSYIEIDVEKNSLELFFGPNGQVVTNENCQTRAQASSGWYMGLGLRTVYTTGDDEIVNLALLT